MLEPALFRFAEQANQHIGDNQIEHRSNSKSGKRLIGCRVDIAGNLQQIRNGRGERQRRRVQHQDHLIAVCGQRDAQRRRQNNAAVELKRWEAVGARGLDFPRRHRANRPGENFGGVGAGVKG